MQLSGDQVSDSQDVLAPLRGALKLLLATRGCRFTVTHDY